MYSVNRKNKIASSFFKFNSLGHEQKLNTLESAGILLDTDEEKNNLVKLYFIDGFFVEKIVSKATEAVVELIPFKNGYRVHHFLN